MFIVQRRPELITNLVTNLMGIGVTLSGHKRELFIVVRVRTPVVQMAWYTDIFPVETKFTVALTKTSAMKEWLVTTLAHINPMNVITTELCAAGDVITADKIAVWCICLNALWPAIARKPDMR